MSSVSKGCLFSLALMLREERANGLLAGPALQQSMGVLHFFPTDLTRSTLIPGTGRTLLFCNQAFQFSLQLLILAVADTKNSDSFGVPDTVLLPTSFNTRYFAVRWHPSSIVPILVPSLLHLVVVTVDLLYFAHSDPQLEDYSVIVTAVQWVAHRLLLIPTDVYPCSKKSIGGRSEAISDDGRCMGLVCSMVHRVLTTSFRFIMLL